MELYRSFSWEFFFLYGFSGCERRRMKFHGESLCMGLLCVERENESERKERVKELIVDGFCRISLMVFICGGLMREDGRVRDET